MEGGTLAESVRYFYSLDEYRELDRERRVLQERVEQLESELRRRRPWWGKLRAVLRGGNQS